MASAELTVTQAVTDELVRVIEATMREYDVDYIWLRSPTGVPLGVVMTPGKFKLMRDS